MKLLTLTIFTIGITQCASMKFEQNPPFAIVSSAYNHWVGGVQGVQGTTVQIIYTSEKDIEFDTLYFNGLQTSVKKQNKEGQKLVVGNFDTSVVSDLDLVLDKDPKKEFGNKPPKKEEIPFTLKENEAVISYKQGDVIKYVLIKNIKKTATTYLK